MDSPRIESLEIEDLLVGYRKQRFAPVDVINEVYDRIDAYHEKDKAVWITLIPREQATAYAAALENKYAGESSSRAVGLPPLYGVPFSVKDSFDVVTFSTTVACPSYAYQPSRTATVVQRLLDAGAIMVGKTNLEQFATGLTGCRSPYGTPRCVYDPAYVTGGSSSGAAVSVGARLVSFAVGSDTAGSIRMPAALNGLVGWKPTLGTLSAVGVVPAVATVDCVCVIAKTVDDAQAAWNVMKGFDEEDPYARRVLPEWPWPFPRGGQSEQIRFGVPPPELLEVLSPDYATLFSAAVETLTSAVGMALTAFDYTPFQAANEMLYGSSIVTQRLVAFEDYIRKHGLEQLHPAVGAVFAAASSSPQGAPWTAVDAHRDLQALQWQRRAAEAVFRDSIDILVVPTAPTHFTVAEVDEDPLGTNKVLGAFSQFVNPLDLCAVAVPAGTWKNPGGRVMPFGITLIGQAGRDEEILDLGRRVMNVL